MNNRSFYLYNRRTFLKIAGYGIAGFFLLLWQQLLSRHRELTGGNEFRKVMLTGQADGINFFEYFLVVKRGALIKVFANTCPHAGCKINKEHNGEILCPCHGSKFSADGKVLKGPSLKALKQFAFTTNPTSGEITVKL